MGVDQAAVKIAAGIVLGALAGALTFESLNVRSSGSQPAQSPAVTSTAPVASGQAVAESLPTVRLEAPISSPNGPLWLPAPAPREKPLLVTETATFSCATRKGASRVNVGWAVALLGKHPAARSKFASPAAAATYSTSLAWGGEGMSLAVSCSAGTPATQAATVARAPAAPRPMVPLTYPAESAQPMGLQISGLFKPATDAMP